MRSRIIWIMVLATVICTMLVGCRNMPYSNNGTQPEVREENAAKDSKAYNENPGSNAIAENMESKLALGDSFRVTDSDTGESHEVVIHDVHLFTNLSEADIDSQYIAGYIFEAGLLDNQNAVQEGNRLLVLDVSITKIANGSLAGDTADLMQLKTFSLSDACLMNAAGDYVAATLDGFVQPKASQLPDKKSLFLCNIPNEGDTIECQMVWIVDSSFDRNTSMFVLRRDKLILVGLEQ